MRQKLQTRRSCAGEKYNRRVGSPVERLEDRRLLSNTALNYPAVPLVTSDPYLSVWSESDTLNGSNTVHWTGTENSLISLIRIDGTTYRLMGDDPSTLPAFPQTSVQVLPTRTIYNFDDGHVHVTMTFMTPALPSNLDVLSRPLTYINWDVHTVDGAKHTIQIYDSTSSELAVNTTDQVVTWGRGTAGPDSVLHVGTTTQTLLQPAGDGVRIDWGYAYMAGQASVSKQGVGGDTEMTSAFITNGTFYSRDDSGTRAVSNDQPVMAFTYNLGSVGSAVVSRHVIVAYDELYSIDYFGKKLLPYWKRNGTTMLQLISTAESQYSSLVTQCTNFDTQLMTDLTTEGGSEYAQLAALAYRQSLAAEGLAADANGQPMLFTKEQTSNGDIATVDVLFPSDPMLFLLSPTLAKASLQPVFEYAASSLWTFTNAPHDLGTYPQALGRPDGGEQMPVEESANMIIMTAAIAKAEGNNPEYANQWWTQLTQWANFLKPYAVDPGDQLTTDDFLGTIDHSSNLAVKAIEALGAYGQLCALRGDTSDANTYTSLAKADATHWMSVTTDGTHYTLAYNDPGTWSELYNLVWDKILGLNIFPSTVASNEVAYYKSIIGQYGLPVESTTNIAKVDWSTWTATLAGNLSDFETLFDPVYHFIDSTGNNKPLQDSYDITNVNSGGFDSRPVVGGIFIKMLADPAMWAKYAGQDTTKLGTYAAFPTTTAVVPDALTSAQNWLYTTSTPSGSWYGTSYNTAGWSSGLGGFGTAGTPGAVINTTWNTSDIYLRKTVTLPTTKFSQLEIQAYHDEDMQVYINGILATSAAGYATSYGFYDISAAALAKLTPGATVTIAVHCHQTVGGQDIDVGLVNVQ